MYRCCVPAVPGVREDDQTHVSAGWHQQERQVPGGCGRPGDGKRRVSETVMGKDLRVPRLFPPGAAEGGKRPTLAKRQRFLKPLCIRTLRGGPVIFSSGLERSCRPAGLPSQGSGVRRGAGGMKEGPNSDRGQQLPLSCFPAPIPRSVLSQTRSWPSWAQPCGQARGPAGLH